MHSAAHVSPDEYLAFSEETITYAGVRYRVRVHWAVSGGRAIVVGLDLRTWTAWTEGDPAGMEGSHLQHFLKRATVDPINDEWTEVTATVMRHLEWGKAVSASRDTLIGNGELDRVRQQAASSAQQAARERERQERERQERERAQRESEGEDGSPALALVARARRRGPQPILSEATLQTVVAPAYAAGGAAPVGAVRTALEEDQGRMVTLDQAKKAVARARSLGYIPPAKGGRR
jgi:hypothetical protein